MRNAELNGKFVILVLTRKDVRMGCDIPSDDIELNDIRAPHGDIEHADRVVFIDELGLTRVLKKRHEPGEQELVFLGRPESFLQLGVDMRPYGGTYRQLNAGAVQ